MGEGDFRDVMMPKTSGKFPCVSGFKVGFDLNFEATQPSFEIPLGSFENQGWPRELVSIL